MAGAPAILQRDYLPSDLRPHLRRHGISQTIAVQAAESAAETDFLLELAAETDFVVGVVGWLDLEDAGFPEKLEHYLRQDKFVGLRPMLQDLPDDDWILRPQVLAHLNYVAQRHVPFDVLTYPRHLSHILTMLDRVPELRAVLDHLSKPPIRSGRAGERWRAEIGAVASFPNVYCKVSGLVTEAAPNWGVQDLKPYVEHALSCFGARRLMFGSDWPVCQASGTYDDVIGASNTLLAPHLSLAELAAVFGGNARAFYNLAG